MKVNSKKTAMTCISGAQSYEARAHIFDGDGVRVGSGPGMKLLGFHMSATPTVHAHVDALCKRMRQKFWVLYHLKKMGFTEEELAKVYRTCLLPFLRGLPRHAHRRPGPEDRKAAVGGITLHIRV